MDFDLKGRRILIIDDEPDAVHMMSLLLEKRGAKVYFAYNGQQGFNIARTEVPDLILSDISMPEVDGWEFIRLIKQFPTTATIPVMAITAHNNNDYRQRILAAGFQYFSGKPINPAVLVNKIKTILK